MEDPWGSNAWSTTDSGKSVDGLPKDPPKWNAFERDADENTMDVGVPSWSAATDSGWVEGTNMWHAETSTLDAWKPSLSIDEPTVEPEEEPEEDGPKEEEEEEEKEGERSPEPRPILPTPPLSPLPTIPSVTPPSSPPRPVLSPPSPDPFGSFESAEVLDEQPPEASSWTPKTPRFPLEAENEPWGGGWGGGEMGKEKEDHHEEPKDEWALAQETRRKRDRKVPPELLESLVTRWDEFVTTFYPKLNTEGDASQSWRKGLDSVDGLTELVDSLIPVTSFPPPMPFNKTAVAKSVRETLRLTRFVPMAQASPMAHLHATKGSTDWEKSVKAQKAVANDEWGWDLKHEPEENSEPADLTKDKKGGGLLSFWSRKASSTPNTPAADPPPTNPPKSPTIFSKATSPTTSTRPSTDSSRIASPTTATVPASSPSAVDVSDVTSSDAPSAQPSAVSRFFNRFSRKPSAVTAAPSGKEGRSSISLSPDDFSFLSDVAPTTSEGSLSSHRESSSANSLETMLSMPTTYSSKLPPPLHPPPAGPSRPTGHKTASSQGSNLSFDARMAETQFMDLLDNIMMGGGTGSKSGYAPVTALFSETSVEGEVPSPALQSRPSPMDLPPMQVASVSQQSSFINEKSLAVSPVSESRSRTPMTLPSTVPPPFTPPIIHNAHGSSLFSGASSPPIPPPRTPDGASKQTIALARLDNPLPPTPKRDIDDALSFLSASPSSHSQLLHGPSSSTKASATSSFLSSVSDLGQSSSVAASSFDSSSDFGDFGDFISTPLRTPSPPKVPQKTFNIASHKPTLELVEKAASRHGRWPASPLPSPLPQPLAPPPSSSPVLGGSGMAQSQLDFLTSDDTPSKVSSTPGTFPMSSQATPLSQPFFGGPLSHPTSAFFNQSSAPSIPVTASRTSTPLMPPDSQSSKPGGASGLSAQDLSFFESL